MNFCGRFFFIITVIFALNSISESALLSLTTDVEALLAFKSQISVDLPNPMLNWIQQLSPCNWSGVSCDKIHHRVVKIDLSGYRMTGSISPHLGNLSFLESLELQQNHLTGEVPPQIGNLFNLQILNLSFNSLGGVIPSNITRWKALRVLDLRRNQVSGSIPEEISHLTQLQVLDLQGNQLSANVPGFLANFSNLEYLNLGTNQFRGPIPGNLDRLCKLKTLDLSANHLSGNVPHSIYNISSLLHLSWASNELSGEIPGDIGLTLPYLLALISCYNYFTGTIPWSLHNLTNIKIIRLSDNLLHGGIPPGIGNLPELEMYQIAHNNIATTGLEFLDLLTNSTRLKFLDLEYNHFEGEIPVFVGNLSKDLTKLYMGGNKIYGKIPSSIGKLTNLGTLSLLENFISGEIPQEMGQLKELKILELSANRLYGTIPVSLGNLIQLTKIDLSKNELKGSIPHSFGNLQCMISLDLSYNNLSGSIPIEILKLPKLSAYLNLSVNHLTGSLPSEIGSLENIMSISISDNKLSGNIPNSIWFCKSLEKLLLARNEFSGRIPGTLGHLKGLEILDLSSNQLAGKIPLELQELKALQLLNLSFNKLEGYCPTGGIFAESSKVHLEGNGNLYSNHIRKRKLTFIYVIASAAAVIFISIAIGLLYYIRKRKTGSRYAFKFSTTEHEMITYKMIRLITNDFNEENLIGSGSFGYVYRGDLQGVDIAIKVLDTSLTRSRKSFLAECIALKNIRHRNLVKLINICSSVDSKNKEFLALIYQLMSNGSLDDWLKSKKRHPNGKGLTIFDRLSCAIGIASAIDYLHNETNIPIVHCDLKPSNVLLDSDMTPKVADFGLAKLLCDENKEIQSFSYNHSLTGSIGYIPPEYGLMEAPSTAGDVYSFGILLLELFTGKSPTNDLFTMGLSLRNWVEGEFENNLRQILDPELIYNRQSMKSREQCLNRVFWIGLSCTAYSPNERIKIKEALSKLKVTQKNLLQAENAIDNYN